MRVHLSRACALGISLVGVLNTHAVGQLCNPAGEELLAEIDSILEAHAQGSFDRDSRASVEMYADSIFWAYSVASPGGQEGGTLYESREAQRAGYEDMYDRFEAAGRWYSSLTYETTEATQCGETVFQEGVSTAIYDTPDGTASTTSDFLFFWKPDEAGELKLHAAMWRDTERVEPDSDPSARGG